ncbi:MAG: histone deacetylase [Acidimicrobiia bacterium]|nr:histone deacetylase [Acidimicrobiia bacterium]
MSVHLVTNELSLRHVTPPGHPERPARVTAVIDAIRSSEHPVVEVEAPEVDMSLLATIHDTTYIDRIRAFCVSGGGALDPDTYVVPASWDAAIHAAGAGPAAVDRLWKGSGTAFVAVRPPGHHAERHQAMGFCLFNNIAITASYLRAQGERVAIVDWDVHHGNGTQRSFYEDSEVLYVSLHEFPFFPGTGWVDEVGTGPGRGMTVNVPIPAATSAASFLAAFHQLAMPPIRQFAPSWILISSGYDAHVRDPLGELNLESVHYGWMASALASVVPQNRIVAFLEGGYDLSALGTSAIATLTGLIEGAEPTVWPSDITGSAAKTVGMAREAISTYWDLS